MKANYCIVEDDFLEIEPLIIKDVGPWDRFKTVTNAAEEVVQELVKLGKLPPGRRLFYYDSDGNLDEIVIIESQFYGFAPLPKTKQ